MIWRSVYDMVRDGLLSGYQYALLAVQALPVEQSESTLGNIITYAGNSISQFTPKVLRKDYGFPLLFETAVKRLLETPESEESIRLNLISFVITCAGEGQEKKSINNIARLKAWLEGTDPQLGSIPLKPE